ncbi:HNH endonuclease [Fragilaria crotonensis]|nr:HNH endonuclease [Fragilaria crotonensis]
MSVPTDVIEVLQVMEKNQSQLVHSGRQRMATSHWRWVAGLVIAMAASTPISVHSFVLSNRRMFTTPVKGSTQPVVTSSTARFSQLEEVSLSSSSSATTMPVRKAKHKGRRSSNPAKKEISSRGSILTEEELCQHVTAQYIHGPGGTLRASAAKRYHQQEEQELENIVQLKRLDQHPALVLNADYQPISFLPLSMWHWQEAVKAVFSGKVTVVEVYPDVTIRAANLEIPLPSVIALNEYVQQPNNKPAFTKRNVFLRDEYRCQYCSHRFHTRDLSLDHVMPRCMGGRLVWENAVTCCKKCNGRKGSLTVDEIKHVGMKLRREPYTPTQYQLHKIAGQMLPKKVHPCWAPYLGLGPSTSAAGDFFFSEEVYLEDIP